MENFGNGYSTSLDQTALGKAHTGFTANDLMMTNQDKAILQQLAEEVAIIAQSEEMEEKRQLWRKINRLEKTRPVIFCDPENGWNEIITEKQMCCQGKIARQWEMDLRKELFWGNEMGDDKPIEAIFNVMYLFSPDDWGVNAIYHKTDDLGSYVWDNPIRNYAKDLKKLHSPIIVIDKETTDGCLEIAHDVFDGILEIRLTGIWWWSLGLTVPVATFRGLNNMFLDFIDHPDELRELLSVISRGYMDKLDFLEQNKLLTLNNGCTYVGSGGFGFTDELPQEDFNGHVRCQDMWGFSESQETVNISPEMYESFIYEYEKPILDRFGLNCYGCCEPLHSRWDIVRRHHNLRRVSCSAWADLKQMAEYLGKNYILSLKPNPAPLAQPGINKDAIRQQLRHALEITRGCMVEVIMKDNHTIGNRPENLIEWCGIAKEEAERSISMH